MNVCTIIAKNYVAYARVLAVRDAGHDESQHWPYEFEALGDGTRIDDPLGGLYDEYTSQHPRPVASPFTLEGAMRF